MSDGLLCLAKKEVDGFLYNSFNKLSELASRYVGNHENLYSSCSLNELERLLKKTNLLHSSNDGLVFTSVVPFVPSFHVLIGANYSEILYYEKCESLIKERNLFNNFLAGAYLESLEEDFFPHNKLDLPIQEKIKVTRLLLATNPDFYAHMREESKSLGYSLEKDLENEAKIRQIL